MSGCEDDGPGPGEDADEQVGSGDADGHVGSGDADDRTVDWGSRIVANGAGPDVDSDDDHGGDARVGDDIDALEDELREHGLFAWLDLEIETVEPGHVVFVLPFDEKFANLTSGTVHGGITATVIDTASGFALQSTFDDPAAAQLTTTDLNVRYLRPARGDLRVEAEVVRAGGSMGVTDCEVTTVHGGEWKVVATGGTSYRLFRE